VLRFLSLLPNTWPAILAAEGALDPADRRNRLLRRQAALWRKTPPSEPVIAAGLVGGFAALDELLGVVAGLPQGAVILPGLDRSCGPELWDAIASDPAHPQYLVARLLGTLEIAPDDVRDWPISAPRPALSGREPRLRLVAEAMRPAR